MKAFFETRSELLYVGQMTSYPFPLHVHENVELACVLSGSCAMHINETVYQLKAGDFAVIFPLTPHSYDSVGDGTRGFAAFFSPDVISEFTSAFHNCIPDEPVIPADKLDQSVYQLVEQLMATPNEEYSPFRQAYLHLLLANVLGVMRLRPADTCNDCGLAAKTIRYIYEHACEKITLSSAAFELGISKSHLSHLFSQQFHINFRHFINAIRIEKAMMQMHDPKLTLTEICFGCGYENMRTFRRAFVQETGMLPSEYMRQSNSLFQNRP